jgi:hypothetical protein
MSETHPEMIVRQAGAILCKDVREGFCYVSKRDMGQFMKAAKAFSNPILRQGRWTKTIDAAAEWLDRGRMFG